MKLARLRFVKSELERSLAGKGVESAIYFSVDSQWHMLDDASPVPNETLSSCNRAAHEKTSYHAASDQTAWFPVLSIGSVIAMKFATSPQANTRKRFAKLLEDVMERASNAYKVAHNPLTSLLARDEFNKILTRAIAASNSQQQLATERQDSPKSQTLAILALDIDHFKQVNDTHGHLYGDQVLKVFALRLEEVAGRIAAATPGLDIAIGHPSGEEFLVCIQGPASKMDVLEWAGLFRARISDELLPSDAEWDSLKVLGHFSLLEPPPLQERSISTSIGVAFYSAPTGDRAVGDQLSAMLDLADTALYRAKSSGRNQVISFDDVMSHCGRVLDQDKQTRILAIDVGKNVGVVLGQEFKVYTPNFSGATKYRINDGRTTRTIGTYPRVELTRITVFDVQPEISFAYITNERDSSIEVGNGCHLEAIPFGSIGRPLQHSEKYFARDDAAKIGDIGHLQEFIKAAAESSSKPFAAVFRFRRHVDFLKRYGQAAVNSALERLYRAVNVKFHSTTRHGILDRSSICVVGANSAYDEKAIEDLVKQFNEELPELGLVAGVFSDKDAQTRTKAEAKTGALGVINAIDFARFAVSDYALTGSNRIEHFSFSVAEKVLDALRASKLFKQGMADYESLKALGVENDRIENQGGLIYSALELDEKALECYLRAIELDPSEPTFRSNAAVKAYAVGDIDLGLKVLEPVNLNSLEEMPALNREVLTVNYARLLAVAKSSNNPGFDPIKFEQVAHFVLSNQLGTAHDRQLISAQL